jgi:hypothetical protein
MLAWSGCSKQRDDSDTADGGGGIVGDDDGAEDTSDATEDGGAGGQRLDVLNDPTDPYPPCEEGDTDCEPECEIPEHEPCDDNTDPIRAMGLNCPGEHQVNASTEGHPGAIGVRSSFGGSQAFDPREGQRYAVLGSGFLAELDSETPDADGGMLNHASPTYCNDDLGAEYDKASILPEPLKTNDVGAVDCVEDPSLVGTGDCSNTIQGQFEQGSSANDYTEIRFDTIVPGGVTSLSYDFAFMSTEYPFYYGTGFNDMYIGWLDSEAWTGNISFDEQGNPISLNAGFLNFKDDGGVLPAYAGTCMRYHAGTEWLSTTAAVVPGEQITVVFAIFDLSDSILDSYVFLDNFLWGCEGEGRPSTKPVG